MSWLPLSFGFPAVLFGLIALPAIWWLLRLTPPRPQAEIFPPLKILARVLRTEETPHRSPWWLTLLRLVMAALIIFALAEPIYNPREGVTATGSAVALVIDNGWASAKDWDKRVATAERLIADARAKNEPVLIAFTAEKPNVDVGPFDAQAALDHLRAARPRPVPVDRPAVFARVAGALGAVPGATIAVLSDGLAAKGDEAAFKELLSKNPANLVWATSDRLGMAGLTASENDADAFVLTAIRAPGDPAPRQVTAGAFDDKGRRIADAAISFGPGQNTGSGRMAVPFELRNDFASIAIDGENHAGAVRVLDENSKRRRVGLLSQADSDQAQPLLSPLYYIRRALQPFADLTEPGNADLAISIPQLIEQKPAMIVLADIGTIPDSARAKLVDWVHNGGTLVRFAGSRLAAAAYDEELLPVRLRTGERALGGALSWTEPQPVSDFPATGPFGDLTPPSEVTVSRQVLAEPTPDIAERTWANLADGTPLVTGARRGKGTVVLFHITPEATWSNLPISGSFVEMLRRLVQLSRNQGTAAPNAEGQQTALAPHRMIDARGILVPPPPEARPLMPGATAITIENPPGLYGTEEGLLAHNLLPADASFVPIARPEITTPVTNIPYAFDDSVPFKGPLVGLALLLMALDALAVLWMGGQLTRRAKRAQRAAAAVGVVGFLTAGLALSAFIPDAHAQNPAPAAAGNDAKPTDVQAIDAISKTRLAYVLTGNGAVDSISRAGLEGLTKFLIDKTALEPGDPSGVDIATDELSFYPLIYWPIDPSAAMPTEDAIARVDAYMKQGGTVLFDTRDQYASAIDGSQVTPATERLRDILAHLNVPPLEPVPSDHVLTKAFYILPEFPGRFNGSPLWVEASAEASNTENRPVRTGDGVSPIMITANDFAGAWAVDENGNALLPTVPSDPMQRIYAYRAGVNIMMYMLTGNYKSDQVHVPILLERLGQ
ncbi:DUF4159 domain-containing protein [Mesorhizobium sp. BAC0120]|uniref:DUF4159 domain-containing protein n=1 Tax=Mesorhizobium sp. BAC0120 TaxID=3090670 RepID=UPI00298D116B|nr:DUF4159 domain-containing protein [Mesorhizobium sp. BAC0120]MDW6022275.1 DUF4159 domain-containing protein [Mesorhizobium sp. BAC0120]